MHYGSIKASAAGIVFLGTPHRGSEITPWAVLLSNVVNSLTLRQGIRMNLLGQLDSKSTTLMEISRQFTHRATSLKIMSFIEQQPESPLTTLVRFFYSYDSIRTII
jgi:hypothetical protein